MFRNPEFERAREELELLKQRERELEERLGIAKNPRKNKGDARWENIEDIVESHSNGYDPKPNMFARETENSNGYNKFNSSEQVIYVDKQEGVYKKLSWTMDTEEEHHLTDDDDESIGEKRRSKSSATKNNDLLINFNSDEEETTNDFGDNNVSKIVLDGMNNKIIYEENEHKEGENEEHVLTDELEELKLSDTTFDVISFHDDEEGNQLNENGFESMEFIEDADTICSSPIDHRDDIFKDIAESRQRERVLKFDRSSTEIFDEYESSNTEDDDEDNDIEKHEEDRRTKIMKEIEEEKKRELEHQAKYRTIGIELTDHDHDEFEKTTLQPNVDPRDMIAFEIQELEKREQELRLERGLEDEEEIESLFTEKEEYLNTRERIQNELLVQQQREAELNHLHRYLSNENLLEIIDNEEEEINDVNENVDTKGKILTEIEEFRLREKELKERLNINDNNSDDDYDVRKNPLAMGIHEQINKEINEIKSREEELPKKRQHSNNNKTELNHTETNTNVINVNNNSMSLKDTKNKTFGSREDLVAYFGTHSSKESDKTSKKITKVNKLKIPELFVTLQNKQTNTNPPPSKQKNLSLFSDFQSTNVVSPHKEKQLAVTFSDFRNLSNEKELYSKNNDAAKYIQTNRLSKMNEVQNGIDQDMYFLDELKPMKASKKKLVLRRKTAKGLISIDVNKEDIKKHNIKSQKASEEKRVNMHPIAAQWERRGEKERQQRFKIERDIQKRKEERLKQATEKVNYEKELRLLKEEENEKKKKKEEERKVLKAKQEGLNQLWTSQKPIVTLDDNSDEDDKDLMFNIQSKKQTSTSKNKTHVKIQLQQAKETTTPSPVMLSKTILKWEKWIAKTQQHSQ